jgi:hypothetical protein
MKVSRSLLLLAVAMIVLALFLSACNDHGSVNGPRLVNFEIAQFAIIDYTDVENGIEDATPESDMTFNSTMLNYTILGSEAFFAPGNPGFMGMRWFDRYDFGKHLGFFFRDLNLTDDQKSAIRDLARTFHDNMKPLVRQFYDANKTIIEDANASRKAIVGQVTAGTLTRADAALKIKDLNQATRDKIKANPASQTIKTAMCAERDKLFAGVKGKLQGEQITKWNNWIAKIKDPCIP